MHQTYCLQVGGQIREVLTVARHTESSEWMVIHRDFFKPDCLLSLATPLSMFQQMYVPVEYKEGKWVKSDHACPLPLPKPITEFRDGEEAEIK